VCRESATADDVSAAMPHPVVGSAVDPIALEPVDDVVVTTLVDNVYDALLTSDDSITRAPIAAGTAQAPQFEPGRTNVGLMAEHGFSALVTVRRGDTTTSILFDTGLSPDAMVINADRLGLDLSGVHAVVLSHGHFDHVGGLQRRLATRTGLARSTAGPHRGNGTAGRRRPEPRTGGGPLGRVPIQAKLEDAVSLQAIAEDLHGQHAGVPLQAGPAPRLWRGRVGFGQNLPHNCARSERHSCRSSVEESAPALGS
jgi:hypothetical protein